MRPGLVASMTDSVCDETTAVPDSLSLCGAFSPPPTPPWPSSTAAGRRRASRFTFLATRSTVERQCLGKRSTVSAIDDVGRRG